MIYTPMTNKAIKVMYEVHENDLDRYGMPYVFHPWHVAESMLDEKRCTTALLHDVFRNPEVTMDILRLNNFPDDVIAAIDVLNKKDADDYATYIRNIAANDIAIDVKIADLMHDLDKSRIIGRNVISKIENDLYESSLNFLIRTKKLNEAKSAIHK